MRHDMERIVGSMPTFYSSVADVGSVPVHDSLAAGVECVRIDRTAKAIFAVEEECLALLTFMTLSSFTSGRYFVCCMKSLFYFANFVLYAPT